MTTIHGEWEGRIVAVNGDTFTAELAPATGIGPVLEAEFRVADLGDDGTRAEVGDIIHVTAEAGAATQVRLLDLGTWSAAEVAQIKADAAAWAAELAGLCE